MPKWKLDEAVKTKVQNFWCVFSTAGKLIAWDFVSSIQASIYPSYTDYLKSRGSIQRKKWVYVKVGPTTVNDLKKFVITGEIAPGLFLSQYLFDLENFISTETMAKLKDPNIEVLPPEGQLRSPDLFIKKF